MVRPMEIEVEYVTCPACHYEGTVECWVDENDGSWGYVCPDCDAVNVEEGIVDTESYGVIDD